MMKKLVVVFLACFLLGAFGSTTIANPDGKFQTQAGVSDNGFVYLFEKTGVPDWDIVAGGASGKAKFDAAGVKFNGKGLTPKTSYTLVSYQGWPDVEILGSAMTNKAGNIHITGIRPIEPGPGDTPPDTLKIWLVLSSDLTGTAFNAWNPLMYLFEHNLIKLP